MKYFEVIPLKFIGKNINLLTYSSNECLCFGQVVKIDVRNKPLSAVVLKEVPKPKFEAKEITSIITTNPIINSKQYDVAKWISEYYLAPIHSCLNLFIPSGINKKRREKNTSTTNKAVGGVDFFKLAPDQLAAVNEIENSQKPILLHGITGSGKTEIYLDQIKKCLEKGEGAIYLVPEISLTPQTIKRVEERFGNKVGLIHSKQLETEKFSLWDKCQKGEIKVVVGPRSALFMPIKDLGLIVIDECHDGSYKQDQTPRYNAINVAEIIAKTYGAKLIIGSATPTIEQYYLAQNNHYKLVAMNKRIVQSNLPSVEIVDMRNEYKLGNKSIFSESLTKQIKEVLLSNDGQVMLFVNRRGMSTFVSCRDCGHIETCPNCDISLTFHYGKMKLTCHHCGFEKTPPTICPECKSMAIKYFGTGTERIEDEIIKVFGEIAKPIRMDSDTVKTKNGHEKIFNDIKNKKYNIIIGTQMITKGWDLENIKLVGIISADSNLNRPDYINDERAFNLLTQVAGRTGRGYHPGKVIIQTYNPDNIVINQVSKHDFLGFYEKQLKEREILGYPPFVKITKILYNNKDKEIAAKELNTFVNNFKNEFPNNTKIIGPSPAFIPKINNIYRYQAIIKSNDSRVKKYLSNNLDESWSIDIDPNGIL
jgi:primosomal protein N' (replication factor Y)